MNFIKGKVEGGVFSSLDGFYHFALTEHQKKVLNGRQITLGYRPEAAIIGEGELGEDKSQYLQLNGTIEVYEMLGDLQNVYLSVGTEKAIIKAKPEVTITIGDNLSYYVKKSDFHFFDSVTEDAIEFDSEEKK